jgi:hypothetical protein
VLAFEHRGHEPTILTKANPLPRWSQQRTHFLKLPSNTFPDGAQSRYGNVSSIIM